MKYNKLLVTLGIILVLAAAATPAVLTAPAMASAQYIHIYPDHGPVGTEVHVYGSAFTPSRLSDNLTARITTLAKTYFPNKTTLVRSTVVDQWGHFETSFVVTECPVGARTVWVCDDSASPPVWARNTFTVEPHVELSESSGYVGDNITVDGTGFAATSSIIIYFDSSAVTTATSNQTGSFTNAVITIPASINGGHSIKAVDASSNNSTYQFSTKQQVIISPTSGSMGEEVTISGTGFAANKAITVTFADNRVVTSPALVTASSYGTFTGKFFVPTCTTNTYSVEASDNSNKAATTFNVLLGGKMNRIVGSIGSDVTFNGAGFVPDRIVIIYFDTIQVAEATVNVYGNFSANFKVPVSSAGEYAISATDGTNTVECTFSVVLVAQSKMDRVIGYIGNDVTFSGTGFIPDRIVSIYYDTVLVAEATVDANGSFTANFKVPASSGGEHTVSATDGTNTTECTFTMEEIAPPTPVSLLPANGSIVEPETHFVWEGVTDPSGVTYTLQIASDASFASDNSTFLVLERSKLTATEYILTAEEKLEPTNKGDPYYWRIRAIDSVSNIGGWSTVQTFYIGGPWSPMSPWILYSLIAEGGIFTCLFGYWFARRIGKS